MFASDKLHEECAVFGIYGHKGSREPRLPWPPCASSIGGRKRPARVERWRTAHIEKAKGLSPISFATGVVTVARHDGHWAQPLFDGGWRRVEKCPALSVNSAFGNLAAAHNGNLNATM